VVRAGGRRTAAAAGGLVLSLALAGCNSNPAPAPLRSDPSTAASSSPTARPSVTPVASVSTSPAATAAPTMPAAARGTGAKSAKAFLRYYIEVVNYAMASGETQPLSLVSEQRCASCRAVIHNVRNVYGNGGRLSGSGWSLLLIRSVQGQSDSRPVLQAGLRIAPQFKWAHTGAKAKHFRGGRGLAIFRLARVHHSWVLTEWSRVQ
jgi:hypothetical protein